MKTIISQPTCSQCSAKRCRRATHNPHMGFSLIELLVSIGVILILVSISFAGYSKLTIKQNLTSAGLLMKNVIRDAQSRAFNSEIDCSKCSCSPSSGSTFVGWVLNFTTKSIYGLCGASTTFSNTSFTLPHGLHLPPLQIQLYLIPPHIQLKLLLIIPLLFVFIIQMLVIIFTELH